MVRWARHSTLLSIPSSFSMQTRQYAIRHWAAFAVVAAGGFMKEHLFARATCDVKRERDCWMVRWCEANECLSELDLIPSLHGVPPFKFENPFCLFHLLYFSIHTKLFLNCAVVKRYRDVSEFCSCRQLQNLSSGLSPPNLLLTSPPHPHFPIIQRGG